MNNDMWQQLNENDENKKSCCSLQNRKSRVVLISMFAFLSLGYFFIQSSLFYT